MKKFLKKIVPPKFVKNIRAINNSVDQAIIPFFASHRILSSIYYLLFSRQFSREQQAVLKGRVAYGKSLYKIGKSSVLLRRNTHRLEKGLIMKPRREVFALAYIDETVDCYIECVKAGTLCDEELQWASDVLLKYFSVIKLSEHTQQLKAAFEQCRPSFSLNRQFIPYDEVSRPELSCDPEQLKQLFIRRRSVRWFEDKPVAKELINKALEMASLAPSACNRQPYQFYLLKDVDAIHIAKLAMGTAGFAENIQNLFVIVGDLSAYPAERDKHVIYIDGSLAAMQLMLGFESLGISTCPINWPDIEFREAKMSQKLDLKAHQRPIMLLAFGYAEPDGKIPFSQKKLPEQLLKEVKL
ncbi:nitroreductase family protein [Thalassotalea sp. PP2-459]|uniref:nitroreductase family protein n=1 Tax=Thalassotalea sp. PP2-459 TaxID=1742724 RepID=UPI000945A510|nr:nitroreductase family protein [Thalassotalea sp. PP2-459]OKY24648.1 nitroreductase-like protein [Thalassotalea sp. PP2-459]